MAYATQDDLVPLRMTEKDLTELTDDLGTNEINADIVNLALNEASGIVDSYCRARYATPLEPDENIVSLTLDLTVYILFKRRRETKISETVQAARDAAIAFLKDVSTAKASLDQPAGNTPQSSTAGPQHSRKDHELVFREEHLEGFV
jgi:phage gp36-like protein